MGNGRAAEHSAYRSLASSRVCGFQMTGCVMGVSYGPDSGAKEIPGVAVDGRRRTRVFDDDSRLVSSNVIDERVLRCRGEDGMLPGRCSCN